MGVAPCLPPLSLSNDGTVAGDTGLCLKNMDAPLSVEGVPTEKPFSPIAQAVLTACLRKEVLSGFLFALNPSGDEGTPRPWVSGHGRGDFMRAAGAVTSVEGLGVDSPRRSGPRRKDGPQCILVWSGLP